MAEERSKMLPTPSEPSDGARLVSILAADLRQQHVVQLGHGHGFGDELLTAPYHRQFFSKGTLGFRTRLESVIAVAFLAPGVKVEAVILDVPIPAPDRLLRHAAGATTTARLLTAIVSRHGQPPLLQRGAERRG